MECLPRMERGLIVGIIVEAIITGLLTGGVYALMASGLTLIFGVMDIINVGQGALVVLGAYLSYVLSAYLHIDLFLGLGCDVLTRVVKFHRALNTRERIARVEFPDEGSIVDAMNLINRLLQHLPHRICLGDVRADRIGCATVFGQVGLNHVSITRVIGLGVPSIWDKHAIGGPHTDGLDELVALIRPRCCNDGLRIIVLLLKGMDESG